VSAMSVVISLILSELQRRGGQASDKELFESVSKLLRSEDGLEITPKEFNKLLLILETRGMVRVTFVRRNLRSVQLIQGGTNRNYRGEDNGS